MDDLLSEFVAETRETLEAIAGEIVAWEGDPRDRGRLDSIFRFVHTVKGSCGFLDLPRLERLSHAAEDVLAEVRADQRLADQALVSAVLAIIDRIGQVVEGIETGTSVPDHDDEQLIAALSEPAAGEDTPLVKAAAVPGARAPARSIRLPVDLLDRMMSGVSDMVLARNELVRRLRDMAPDSGVEAAFDRLSTCVAEMREAITRTRMQRIDNLFTALPRMVRDLAADLGKTVSLEIEGGDVELDREMIEMIRDPLTHIVRNAADHGIEPAAERRAAGKPATGTLRVRARQSGNQILIEISDDGRGIDGDRLVTKAIAAGILSEEKAAGLPWNGKLALMFEPGLSTASRVTAISGRGVGMDVVRANIERIGGVVDVDSRPGTGVRLTLRVPLTLTIIPALTVGSGSCQFAIPRSAIEEIVRVSSGAIRIERIGGGCVANIRGRRLPIVSLAQTVGAADAGVEETTLVVLRPAGHGLFALSVGSVHDHEELVVKPAAPAVMAIGIYAGTTLPDDGRPMLLLDPAGLARAAAVEPDVGMLAEEGVADEVASDAERMALLTFRDLDDVVRGIRLALVERIEDVPAGALTTVGGRLRLVADGRILPVLALAQPDARASCRLLRLGDGEVELGYAIDEVIDIVETDAALAPAAVPGVVAGVALIDGRPVEIIDGHWLFATAGERGAGSAARPLCLLLGQDDAWTREILKPLIEQAGYHVPAEAGVEDVGQAAVIVATAGAEAPAHGARDKIVRLRSSPHALPGDDSIYRYDRPALLAALDQRRSATRN